ncbi:MAG: hypothetical protein AAF702_01510 [Chloroflexota bacterium]
MDSLKKHNIEFFKKLDSKLSHEAVARSYLTSIMNGSSAMDDLKKSDGLNNNISIASDQSSFEYLTKRLPIISDTGILSHNTNNFIDFHSERDHRSGRSDMDPGLRGLITDTSFYLDCSSLGSIGKWLVDCQDLLKSGNLIYIPRFKREINKFANYHRRPNKREFDKRMAERYKSSHSLDPIIDAIIKERGIVDLRTKNHVKSNYIRHILSLEIPVIDNVSLKDFSSITADEKSQFDIFRVFLRQKLSEIDSNQSSEHREKNLEQIKLDLLKGVKSISSDIKGLRTKTAIDASGAIIISVTATLIAINSAVLETWQEVLGAGGGFYLLLKALQENIQKRNELLNQDYYYLWLLDKKGSSLH